MSVALNVAATPEPPGFAARRRAATWITHKGGDRPVSPEAIVAVLRRDLEVERWRAASINWRWVDLPDFWEPDDVVAYRVVGAST